MPRRCRADGTADDGAAGGGPTPHRRAGMRPRPVPRAAVPAAPVRDPPPVCSIRALCPSVRHPPHVAPSAALPSRRRRERAVGRERDGRGGAAERAPGLRHYT